MTTEVWAEADPGYFVSSMGRVRGKSGRILKPSPNDQGYLTFSIGRKSVKLHVLVAKLHVPGWFEGAEVRHLNGDKRDNSAGNLAWGTHAENMSDRIKHGTNAMTNRTHCPQGHPYSSENTRLSNGRRHCRACDREAQRKYRAANRDRILEKQREYDRNRRSLTRLAALEADA